RKTARCGSPGPDLRPAAPPPYPAMRPPGRDGPGGLVQSPCSLQRVRRVPLIISSQFDKQFFSGAGPMRVLIADDHPVVRQGLRQILMSDPEVEVSGEARDGNEVLDLARRVDWDVAILDFSMPGLHGL